MANTIISRSIEHGLLQHFETESRLILHEFDRAADDGNQRNCLINTFAQLTFANLHLLFLIFLTGVIMAAGVFAIELIVSCR